MGFDAIEEDILELTNKIAEERIVQARKKAEELREEAENLIRAEDKLSDDETEKIIQQIRQTADASAKFEIKKIELSTKREVLDQVFAKTKEKIESLDDKTLENLTKILIDDAEKEIEVETIFCNERAKKWIPKKFKTKTENMLGGVIAENKDGTIRVDNRFETLLDEVRRDALKKIAKTVF